MTTTNPAEQTEEQAVETVAPQEVATEEVSTSTPEEALAVQVEAYNQLQNQHLRLAADFDNFRKRRMNELEQLCF
ncbi:MAG: hypothetical protein NTW61_00100 [Candidatus Melainabacteria bacterium]|nr:hypothetical protein [Candidatus Melainabacteria bacterium]